MDVKPAVRFFCHQDNLISFSNTLKEKIRRPLWSVNYNGYLVNLKATNIGDIIDLNYSKYKEYKSGNILYLRSSTLKKYE